MKKIISVLLTIVLLVSSLVACDKSNRYKGEISELFVESYLSRRGEDVYLGHVIYPSIDFLDENNLEMLGLNDSEIIDEAISRVVEQSYGELFGDTVGIYPILILRVRDISKIEGIKETIYNGINLDNFTNAIYNDEINAPYSDLIVASSADLVFVMVICGAMDFKEDIIDEFKSSVGEFTGSVLSYDEGDNKRVEGTTQQKELLNEKCDAVLAKGTSENGDVYELVANEVEDYKGTEITIGVIKNNEWLVEMTDECPFLNENGFIFYNYSVQQYLDSVPWDNNGIKYIGNGCFYYTYYEDYKYYKVIWNTNTNKSYTTTKGSIVLYNDFINDEGKFIFYSQDNGYSIMLDTNTMTETKLKDPISLAASNSKGGIIRYMPYSEGLYCIISYEYIRTGSSWNSPPWDAGITGFYDLEGNLIIDMSEYTIIENNEFDKKNFNNFSFDDGRCDIKIMNDQGSYYIITIDKEGNVINSRKIR